MIVSSHIAARVGASVAMSSMTKRNHGRGYSIENEDTSARKIDEDIIKRTDKLVSDAKEITDKLISNTKKSIPLEGRRNLPDDYYNKPLDYERLQSQPISYNKIERFENSSFYNPVVLKVKICGIENTGTDVTVSEKMDFI